MAASRVKPFATSSYLTDWADTFALEPPSSTSPTAGGINAGKTDGKRMHHHQRRGSPDSVKLSTSTSVEDTRWPVMYTEWQVPSGSSSRLAVYVVRGATP